MLRLIGGTAAGIVVWMVIVTALNLGLRHGWHDYAAVEKAMAFTIPMMVARLSMSAISSLASGFVAALIDKGRYAPLVAGAILLLLFIPVHYSIWSKFPIWYHLTFLVSLPLLSMAGSKLLRAKQAAV
jgi:hypothetical protein